MELKKRNEMDVRYQWDLSQIFPSREAWEKARESAAEKAEAISSLRGTLTESPQALRSAYDQVYEALYETELVYVFASLQKNGDNGNSEYQEMEGLAMNLLVKLESQLAFFDPELLSMSEEKMQEFIRSPQLEPYRHILEDTARAKAHTLSQEEETLLAKLSDAAQTPGNAFEMLESVDMSFPAVRDENGKEQQLTHGNFMVFRESPDRRVRRESFEAYFGEFRRFLNTFAADYAGSVKFDNFYADVRRFPSACERALFSGNVPLSVYDSLVKAVHDKLHVMKKYLSLRRKVLGLEELSMYDLYCPIVQDVSFEVPYEEAQEIVKKALAPFGEEYVSLLERAFSERWIDVYENQGKTTGAFSCGVYGVHPYVLLNYTGTLDDVFTLAHELGHAMHSYFSSREQSFANHDYRILVAEVASTVNEVMLTKYLLATETDPGRRAYILNHFLEGFRTTVYRQTLFAEFERIAHEKAQKGIPLTAQSLSQIYRELNVLYYEGADVPALQDIEWARIPHFYRAFYVYQYATGFCSAVAIASRIAEGGDPSEYLRFLTTGGIDYPIEELKIAGVDLTDPKTVENALDVFESTLEEFEKLLL